MELTNEVIHELAWPVDTGRDVAETIKEMWELLREKGGAGLAAPQVGIRQRIIIINTQKLQKAIINPQISVSDKKQKLSKEGCLSHPGLIKKVKRHNKVILSGYDENWKPVVYKLRAFTAFCAQHEVDHLNGITLENK